MSSWHTHIPSGDQTEAIVVSQNWVEAHFLKGYALVDLQQLAAAAIEYEKALQLAPHNSQVLEELGSLCNKQKNFAKAIEIYHLAEVGSDYAPQEAKDVVRARALRGQGYAYAELKQWDVAEKIYRQSLTLDKDNRLALQEIEYIHQQRGASASGPPPKASTPK